mmetsp:Transcript_30620/g.74758  ORF Transcript_30620/g.74758 Transcript_30620/m.74758 type:complete len:325 (+) Transcript_30620:1045-2019(+)
MRVWSTRSGRRVRGSWCDRSVMGARPGTKARPAMWSFIVAPGSSLDGFPEPIRLILHVFLGSKFAEWQVVCVEAVVARRGGDAGCGIAEIGGMGQCGELVVRDSVVHRYDDCCWYDFVPRRHGTCQGMTEQATPHPARSGRNGQKAETAKLQHAAVNLSSGKLTGRRHVANEQPLDPTLARRNLKPPMRISRHQRTTARVGEHSWSAQHEATTWPAVLKEIGGKPPQTAEKPHTSGGHGDGGAGEWGRGLGRPDRRTGPAFRARVRGSGSEERGTSGGRAITAGAEVQTQPPPGLFMPGVLCQDPRFAAGRLFRSPGKERAGLE